VIVMILSDPHGRPATGRTGGGATLDALFRRAVLRRPDAVALVDSPNREGFTDGASRRLTYAQADRMVSAIAGRLRHLKLSTDAIVGLQTANTVDGVLALMGVLRAGLIAMPMPLLWRRADAVNALSRVGANALIVSGRIGEVDHYDIAVEIAAEVFSIRHVCGFGCDPPDGVIALDDLYMAEMIEPVASIEHERAFPPGPGAHLAVITWDVSAAGLVPVARSHAELIAGGLAVALEGRLEPEATILTTLALSSFGGLAVAMVPWLLVGGTLALHHPFDTAAFAAQTSAIGCDTIVVPGPLVAQFADAGLLTCHGLKSVLAIWHAPERLAHAPTWRDSTIVMVDVQVFGEIGLIAAHRGPDGKPAAIPFGAVLAPRAAKDATLVSEVMPTPAGTVALRGPMVPGRAFPPGAERTELPYFKAAANGFVDTGYGCRIDQGAPAMAVTGAPPGVASVGGYRFVVRDLQETVSRVDGGASLAVLPDALGGQRLAGSAADRAKVQEALTRLGVNPLLVGAFRDRRNAA
jgi:hypothetical protein